MRDSARIFKAAAVAALLHLSLFAFVVFRPGATESLVVRGGGIHETVEVIASGERKSVARVHEKAAKPLPHSGMGEMKEQRQAEGEKGNSEDGDSPGGGDAILIGADRPTYPLISRKLGEEGVVRLRLNLAPDGRTNDVQVIRSSGFERLDQSALEFARRARFQAPSSAAPREYTVKFVLKEEEAKE